jgi:SpoVK/Ycf46/Vps4 family AAA+-type ATPase
MVDHHHRCLPVIVVEVIPFFPTTSADGDDDDTFSGCNNGQGDVDGDGRAVVVDHHGDKIDQDRNIKLTNFSVREFLLHNKNYDNRNGSGGGRHRWYFQRKFNNVDVQNTDIPEIVSGFLVDGHSLRHCILDRGNESTRDQGVEVTNRPTTIEEKEKESVQPIDFSVSIPSDDPLQLQPVSCTILAYVHRNHFLENASSSSSPSSTYARSPAIITSSTVIRLMSPRRHHLLTSSPCVEMSAFLNRLLGEEGNQGGFGRDGGLDSHQYYEDIIRCFDPVVVDELTLKLRRLASKAICIGTSVDALYHYRKQHDQLKRLRSHVLVSSSSLANKSGTFNKKKNSYSVTTDNRGALVGSKDPQLWWPSSLIVHSPNHCDGKTLLVEAILANRLFEERKERQEAKDDEEEDDMRSTSTDCIHVIRAGPLLAKYGSRADAALESQIHAAILSSACRRHSHRRRPRRRGNGNDQRQQLHDNVPPLCAIIFDQLESFLPSRLSGTTSSGDASVPVVNAIASYLRSITSTMQRRSEFPFPVKNPLYNNAIGATDQHGQVLSVRLCLVGIVTCPDDGWKSSQKTSGGMDSTSMNGGIFDSMGDGDRFRLPLLTDYGRFAALKSFLISKGLHLDSHVTTRLETLASSCHWVKAEMFNVIACRLKAIIDAKHDHTGTSTTVVEVTDLNEAFASVRHDHVNVSRGTTHISNVRPESDDDTHTRQAASTSESFHFASVGGAEQAKLALEDALALDSTKRRILHHFGLRPPSGVLLYGPPGTGKTLLAKAVACLLGEKVKKKGFQSKQHGGGGGGGKFISLSISDVVSSELGTSEKTILTTFEYADQHAPAVIFLDEFQALFTDRSAGGTGRLTTTLLQCLDDIHRWQDADDDAQQQNDNSTAKSVLPRVTVIAATNTPWMIDNAFLRPGRFDRVVQVGLPLCSERESIFLVHTTRMKIKYGDGDSDGDHPPLLKSLAKSIADKTEGYSGADLAALCRAAAVRALIDCEDGQDAHVTQDHFEKALLHDVRPSSDDQLVNRLAEWRPGR